MNLPLVEGIRHRASPLTRELKLAVIKHARGSGNNSATARYFNLDEASVRGFLQNEPKIVQSRPGSRRCRLRKAVYEAQELIVIERARQIYATSGQGVTRKWLRQEMLNLTSRKYPTFYACNGWFERFLQRWRLDYGGDDDVCIALERPPTTGPGAIISYDIGLEQIQSAAVAQFYSLSKTEGNDEQVNRFFYGENSVYRDNDDFVPETNGYVPSKRFRTSSHALIKEEKFDDNYAAETDGSHAAQHTSFTGHIDIDEDYADNTDEDGNGELIPPPAKKKRVTWAVQNDIEPLLSQAHTAADNCLQLLTGVNAFALVRSLPENLRESLVNVLRDVVARIVKATPTETENGKLDRSLATAVPLSTLKHCLTLMKQSSETMSLIYPQMQSAPEARNIMLKMIENSANLSLQTLLT